MYNNSFFKAGVILCLLFYSLNGAGQSDNKISLAGKWRIVLDGNNKDWPVKSGVERGWYKSDLPSNQSVEVLNKIYFKNEKFEVTDTILLPGSTDEAGIGVPILPGNAFTPGLERKMSYDGAFWIQKSVYIPSSWHGMVVRLFMERVPGASAAFWDGKAAGSDYGYSHPHTITLDSSVLAGVHQLTVLINKEDRRYASEGHQLYNATGTTWNGVIGRLELQYFHPIASIKSNQIFPDIENKQIRVQTVLNQLNGSACSLTYTIRKKNQAEILCEYSTEVNGSTFSTIKIPEPVILWSEFNPALYELTTSLYLNGNLIMTKTQTFGMREIGTRDGQITMNGRKIFIRGTLDCGSYALTAYPYTEKKDWLRVMNIVKDYGLNQIRFHTWCPPEAAFEAADETGIYLQPELCGPPYAEAGRLLDTYGNHPSFCMLSLNNEREHNNETRSVTAFAKEKDPRHLYTCTSQPLKPDCTDDFYVSAWGNKPIPDWPYFERILGITWGGGDVIHASRFNLYPPETCTSFEEDLKGINAPVITHEMGQWAMFPNLDEISKYTGILQNTNYSRILRAMETNGISKQYKDFAEASGKFSALLYKEEMEATMRTKGMGGFQLLGLNDYQGQYISLVGILDAFWDSKGITSPEEHKRYCNSVTPLALLKKRCWNLNEKFETEIKIANYSLSAINDAQVVWTLESENGIVLSKGKLSKKMIPSGELTDLGVVRTTFGKQSDAARLKFIVAIPGTSFENSWDIWIYPTDLPLPMDNIPILTKETLLQNLPLIESGGKAILQVSNDDVKQARESCFTTIFWNSIFKWPQRAHTMGILCNPRHPLFRHFPTDSFSNWQWWDISMHSKALNMNNVAAAIQPLIQVIDSYEINDKLAYLWECKIGKGSLIVSGIDFKDLDKQRPASQQLFYSLKKYMNSKEFNPEISITVKELQEFIVIQ